MSSWVSYMKEWYFFLKFSALSPFSSLLFSCTSRPFESCSYTGPPKLSPYKQYAKPFLSLGPLFDVPLHLFSRFGITEESSNCSDKDRILLRNQGRGSQSKIDFLPSFLFFKASRVSRFRRGRGKGLEKLNIDLFCLFYNFLDWREMEACV